MRKSRLIVLTVFVFLAFTLCACVGPQSTANIDEVRGPTTNGAFTMGKNAWFGSSSRIFSGTEFDADGFNKLTDTPTHDMAVLLPVVNEAGVAATTPDGTPVYVRLFNSDPSNSTLRGFTASFAGGFTVGIDELGRDVAGVIKAYELQQIQHLLTAQVITQEQAKALTAAVSAGKELAVALAELGIKAFVPVP
jgi:hypothetical protein